MNVKITDLLDDYADSSVLLPSSAAPTAQRTRQLVHRKIAAARRRPRLAGRALLAATLGLLLTLGAVAGGLTLWQHARADLGVSSPESIPEYTEYAEAPSGGPLTLVSTFCSGSRVVFYAQADGVTQQMADEWQSAWDSWGFSLWSLQTAARLNCAFGIEQLSYDAEAQRALLRVELTLDDAPPEALEITLYFDREEGGNPVAGSAFGTLTIPVTPSGSLTAACALSLGNTILNVSGTLIQIELEAGSVRVTLDAPALDDYLAPLGENAETALVQRYLTYFGADANVTADRMDAEVYYRRSWDNAAKALMQSAVLTLADGTQTALSTLFSSESWGPDADCDVNTGRLVFTGRTDAPLELAAVQSLTIGETTVTFAE